MLALIRIVTILLLISLAITLLMAFLVGGAPLSENRILIVPLLLIALALFATYWWASGHSREIEDLEERVRGGLVSGETASLQPQRYSGRLRDLAVVLDEWRMLVLDSRRRMAEEELVRARILDGIGEGVMAISRRKSVVLANRRMFEMFDLPGHAIGVPFYQVLRNASVHEAFDRALGGERVSERIVLRSRLAERQIDVSVVPVADETDVAAVALFIDVTGLVRLERIRRDFLTDFSHEVRTPLAGLRSAIETLQRGPLGREDEEQVRRILGRQLGRLERLVEDLSELNRIESGDLQLQKQEVDLAALLRDLADDFRDRAAERNVIVEVGGEEGQASVDPQRVQQILVNLVDNAVKFSPPGSAVRLDARRVDGGWVLSVSDRGEGISSEEQERVFHRFYRVDRSRSQSIPGTGLGLAIAKHLTVLHGGRIEVESAPGQGATFRIILPET